MKRTFTSCMVGFALLACGPAPAPAQDLGDVERNVERWVDLRAAIAAERLEWEQQRQRINREIRLLEQEATLLEAQLQHARTRDAEAIEQVSLAQTRERHLAAALEAMRITLSAARTAIVRHVNRIPPALLPECPAPPAAPQESVSADLQSILAFYQQLHRLQHGIHVVRELVPDGKGGRRQVDVLYIGLATGFAVSVDAEWAAVGRPDETGWTWTPSPTLAGAIDRAIRIHRHEGALEPVPLPLGPLPERGLPAHSREEQP